MNAPNHRWRKVKNSGMQTLTFVCALLVIAPLVLVFYHITSSGIGAVNWDFFTKLPKPVGEPGGGMANAIVGTLVLTGLGTLIGVPIGVLGGVYLSEFGSGKMNFAVRFAADILNGTPSIVWGIVVYALVVIPMHGSSAYAGGLALDADFHVEFPGHRAHQIRLQGGDCSTDSFCFV